MNEELLEKKLINLFDNASLEQMDQMLADIPLADLQYKDEVSKMRMKKNVRKKIEEMNHTQTFGKKKSGVKKVMRTLLATAAAFVVIVMAVPTLRSQASELMAKLFSFIPGVGIEESMDTTKTHYIVSEELVKGENDSLKTEITKAYIDNNILTVQYRVDMKNVDIDQVMGTVEAEDPQQAMLQYYDSLGYGKYFDLSNFKMDSISVLSLDGTELKKTASDTFFNEQSGGKYAIVTESFDLGTFTPEDVKGAELEIGDVVMVFTMEQAKQYTSKEALLSDHILCTQGGISVICEPVWDGDCLKASFYVVDTGEYDEVECLAPYTESEQEGIFLVIDGKQIEGEALLDDVCANTYIFDVTGQNEKSACSIQFNEIAVVKGDEQSVLNQKFVFELNAK